MFQLDIVSAPETLLEHRLLFSALLPQLLRVAEHLDFGYTVNEVVRDRRVAALNAASGAGIRQSLHCEGLAVDVNLYRRTPGGGWHYLTESANYLPVGTQWKRLHALCRWGGDFATPDGNHFSITYQGRQ